MDATFLAVIRMGLTVLTDRLLTLLAILMTFGLAAWAMYLPTPERLEIAAGFGILVFIPSLLKERVKTHERPVGQEHEL